jgi:Ala-tRNA(Pro) deacylase
MPANHRLDIGKLKKTIKAKKVTLATEKDMKMKFHATPGAMMPFGAMHKLEVVADASLLKAKHALFSAGSFTESIRMKMKDYMRIAEPRVAHIAKKVPMKLTVVTAKKTKKRRRVQPKKRKVVKRGKRK